MILKLTPEMANYATVAERKYLEAMLACDGKVRKASRSVGVHHKTIQMAMQRLQTKCIAQGVGWDGIDYAIPEPYMLQKSTIHVKRGEDGQLDQVHQAWLKTCIDSEARASFLNAKLPQILRDMDIPILKKSKRQLLDNVYDPDIVPIFNIGDAHFGMCAYAASCQRDFTLEIARREMRAAIDIMIDEINPVVDAVINDLGDYSHYDNAEGSTARSRNLLDTDGTYGSMIDFVIECHIYFIRRLMEKAINVKMIVNRGNHSDINDKWVVRLLQHVFADEPRVTILPNDQLFIPLRIGNTLIMTHHSHTANAKKLSGVMITDYRKDFGQTKFHYIYIGHIHHGMVMKEYPSISIESFNNLAPNDQHADDHAYRSHNSITRVDIHRQWGERGRRRLPIEEIEATMVAKGICDPFIFERGVNVL